MASSFLLLFLAAIGYGVYRYVSALAGNVAKAKRTGLPYHVVPFSPHSPIAQMFPFWKRLFMLLPRKYWEDVMPVLMPDWHFRDNYRVFEKLGDVFLVACPDKLILYTANAEPVQVYKILSLYGESVLATEGAVWKNHRKVTAASFNEKNAALVFAESIKQTQGMIDQWLGADGQGNRTIKTVEHDTMALMLHIIGYVGFGLRLLWPGQSLPPDADARQAKYAALEPPAGHTLNFTQSLEMTLEKILLLLLTPRWLLKHLPFKATKVAAEAEDNFVKYLDEFLHDKIDDVKNGDKEIGMDIMGQLARTSYGEDTTSKKGSKLPKLSDSEITGNAFIMIVAGHETTANTIHFLLLELANNPAARELLQRDIANIFGDTDPRSWDYESSVNALMASMAGACMNEMLRMMPPVVDIPKEVASNDQVIVKDGEKYHLPKDMHIGLVATAVQRNPRYWPTKPSKVAGHDGDSDIHDFVPERWYRKAEEGVDGDNTDSAEVEGADTENYGGFEGPDTSAQLFRPVRGSYIPFSDGARSCLGRRLAQVELISALSVIFQRYSLELAVDEWASDAEVEAMDRTRRAAVYRKAQDSSRKVIASASSLLTLKLHGNKFVPIRLVPKGQERFVDRMDS
ncbi:hypothetical protein PG994_004571 [Apiospora phragmitis]|uniref:Cytochrome P450 n=1 Tax=Apiospora phragmitis TaxID=2905665 RepID=A0ABR1VS53_9PEZI